MDFVVRVFRTLASDGRLRIIQCLLREPDLPMNELADRLGHSPPRLSWHLRKLTSDGLVDARPSGRYILAKSASPSTTTHALLRGLRLLLRRTLREDRLDHAWRATLPGSMAPAWEGVFQAMCFEFTAYTHLRRLLILRLMLEHGQADRYTIARTIGMSYPAVQRQVDKLIRRGLLCEHKHGLRPELSIPDRLATPFKRELFSLVRPHLAGTE